MARYTSVPGLCLCSRVSTDNGEMKGPQEKPCYRASLNRRVVAEAVGTAMLLMAIVGSGIMGERLAAGNNAIALLANSLATGAALSALILTFGPISGAHVYRCRAYRTQQTERKWNVRKECSSYVR